MDHPARSSEGLAVDAQGVGEVCGAMRMRCKGGGTRLSGFREGKASGEARGVTRWSWMMCILLE